MIEYFFSVNLKPGYFLRYLFDSGTNDNALVGDIGATTMW